MVIELAALAVLGAGLVLVAKRSRGARVPPAPAATRDERLAPGDVLCVPGAPDRWMRGRLAIEDDGRTLSLSIAHDGSFVLELAPGERWELAKTRVPAGPCPGELRLGRTLHVLERRGRGRVTADGDDLPASEPVSDYALYAAPNGDRALVLDLREGRLGLVGARLAFASVLPGSEATRRAES